MHSTAQNGTDRKTYKQNQIHCACYEVSKEKKRKEKRSTTATAHLNDKISRFPIIYHNYHLNPLIFCYLHVCVRFGSIVACSLKFDSRVFNFLHSIIFPQICAKSLREKNKQKKRNNHDNPLMHLRKQKRTETTNE